MNGQTTALTVHGQQAVSAYEPGTFTDAMAMADAFAKSGLTKHKTKEQAFLCMATGAELGIPATTALRCIDVVEGKATLSADLMVALVLNSPDCERFDCTESTNERATYTVKRKGSIERTYSFSMEDAKRAGLDGKDNWRKYPAPMLRHRAASLAARGEFPHRTMGLYTRDEAEEITGSGTPAPVQPLPTAPQSAGPIDAEIVESEAEKIKRHVAAIEAAQDSEALKAARAAAVAEWPQSRPAEVSAAYNAAAARIKQAAA